MIACLNFQFLIRLRRAALFTLGLVVAPAITTLVGWLVYSTITNPPRSPLDADRFKPGTYLYEVDRAAGFKTRANVSLMDKAGNTSFEIYTDDRGGRISKDDDKHKHLADVVTVGCSQAWGHGVPNDKTFSSILAQRLSATAENLSVPGYGGVSALARLLDNKDLKPKLVVYGFWEDHLNRNVRSCVETNSPICWERPYVKLGPSGQMQIEPPLAPEAGVEQTRRWYMETASGTSQYRSIFTDLYWKAAQIWRALVGFGQQDTSAAERLEATKYILGEMNNAAASVGAKLIVVFIPLYFDTIKDAPDELTEFARNKGYILVSMSDEFREMRAAGVSIPIAGDGHLSEAAHEAIARRVEAAVRSLNHDGR